MKPRFLAATLVIALLSTFAVGAHPANAARPASGSLTQAVSGSYTDPTTGSAGPFSGTLRVTQFAVQNGQLIASGTVTGLVTYTAGTLAGTTQTVTSAFTAPVNGGPGSCTILDLTIGPIHLDLLGLVLDTNTIHLTITAQQGPGNLLGNLLCAVANLLNGGTSGTALQQLANLLNQILATL